MQSECPFLGSKYGVQVGAKNTILTAIICVRFFGNRRAGALERFHECLLSGASAKNAARSSHAFKKNEVKQQADMRPRRRGGYCIRLCGQAEGKKVLVQVLSGTAPRGTIRGRLFNRGLVPKWAWFLLLVWLICFSNMARKLWIFRACFWVRFSCPFLGQAY